MALTNREELFVLIILLNVILHYLPQANAHNVSEPPPHLPIVDTEEKFVQGGLTSEHPLQPSVETLCTELQDYATYCADRVVGYLNAPALATLTFDLGEVELSNLQHLIFVAYADKYPSLLPTIRPRLMSDANFTFKEARMLVNHPKTFANGKRMDAVGQFPRLADLLRRHSRHYRDVGPVHKSMDVMETLFYVAYALTVEVVWTTK